MPAHHTASEELERPLAQLWSLALPEYAPAPNAVRQRLGEAANRQLLWANGQLLGAAEVAPPSTPWAPHSRLGHLRYLLVAPAGRGRGHGTALLHWAEERLRQLGAAEVALGEERGHYFPGPPPFARSFFETRGYTFTAARSVDLRRDLSCLPPEPDLPGVRFALGTEGGVVPKVGALLAEVFPGRWRFDVAEVAERAPHQLLALMRCGAARGFALIGSELDPVTLPSFLWARALTGTAGPSEAPGLRLGCGLGPMGLHPEERGQGLGTALLHAAMHELARRGGEVMGIDWTGIAPFYEKSGFEVWREYRHARKTL